MRIADLGTVRVTAMVPEKDVAAVFKNQEAELFQNEGLAPDAAQWMEKFFAKRPTRLA